MLEKHLAVYLFQVNKNNTQNDGKTKLQTRYQLLRIFPVFLSLRGSPLSAFNFPAGPEGQQDRAYPARTRHGQVGITFPQGNHRSARAEPLWE